MNFIKKYEFRLEKDNNYHLLLFLTTNSKNIGMYQYVSKKQNDLLPLINGQLTGEAKDIILEKSNILRNEPDLSFPEIKTSLITGYSNSDNIILIKSYNSDKPYVVGKKDLNGTIIEILEVNDNYVKYKIDSIDYTTFFNKNNYLSTFSTTNISDDNDFVFNQIQLKDKYLLTVEMPNNDTNNTFTIFKNNSKYKQINLDKDTVKNTIKFDADINDIIYIFMSSNTKSASTLLKYRLEPEQIDNDANYKTIYYFGNKTLNSNNSLNDGFIYKSDVQPYDDKPITNNYIEVLRNPIQVYDSLVKLGSVGNINDFEEFFPI